MMNVLVVEDEEQLHQFYSDVLGGFQKNITVFYVTTGEDALKVLEESRIDGIFIDLQLPGMNGFTLANRIRRIEKYHFLPIVFATGLDHDTLETYKKHRNIDYVVKPFSRETFVKTAVRFIEEMEAFKAYIPVNKERELYFQHDNGVARIKLSDILFGSTTKSRKMRLVTYEQEFYKSNISFNNFITLIGDDMFVQCNKSYAINVSNIKEIKPVSLKTWDIFFRGAPNITCQLSHKYRKTVESLFRKNKHYDLERTRI